MMQITVDPTKLTSEQREAVAEFILEFPDASVPLREPTPAQAFAPLSNGVASAPQSPLVQAPAVVTAPLPMPALSAPVMGMTTAQVDSSGLPWDARIHSESRATVADGSWRKKRNLDPAVLSAVETQLRTVIAAPAPAAPAPAAPAPAVLNNGQAAFVALVGRASAAIQAGKLRQDEVDVVCQGFGIPSYPMLATRLDLVDAVAARVDEIIMSRG